MDISESGAALNLDREIKNGTVLKLKIQTKNHSTITHAKVIRHHLVQDQMYYVGVHFLYMPDDIKSTLQKIVDEYGKGVSAKAFLVNE